MNTIKNTTNDSICVFSRNEPQYNLSLINNGGKILLFFVLLMNIIAYFGFENESDNVFKTYVISIAIVAFSICVGKILEKVCHKIVFDFIERNIEIYPYRSKTSFVYQLEDIKLKNILGCYLLFKTKDRSFLYSGIFDNRHLRCIEHFEKERRR